MPTRSAARPTALLATVLVTALAVSGCGWSAGEESGSEDGGSTGSDTFPVTVSTAFGDVPIEEEPTRVVALGWSDAETALALGVQPVGAGDGLAVGGDDGLGDWVEDGYGEAPEIIETLEPSYEAIAARPPAPGASAPMCAATPASTSWRTWASRTRRPSTTSRPAASSCR